MPGLYKYRTLILLPVIAVLAAMTVFLATGLHKHDTFSGKACPFSGFERSVVEEPSAGVIVPTPTGIILTGLPPDEYRESAPAAPQAGTRGPPASPIA